jgi:hypothetical protein
MDNGSIYEINRMQADSNRGTRQKLSTGALIRGSHTFQNLSKRYIYKQTREATFCWKDHIHLFLLYAGTGE